MFDAQAVHMAFFQLRELQKNKKLLELKNAVTPGLNDVLSKHEVTHGVNKLKTKFKAIFDDYKECQKYFKTRPIDPDFVSYSAQDVLDLSELALLLEAKIEAILDKGVSHKYRETLVRHLSDTYAQKSCQKQHEINGNKGLNSL